MSLDMLIAKYLIESLQTSRLLWYEHTDCFLEHRNNQQRNLSVNYPTTWENVRGAKTGRPDQFVI